MLNIWSFRNHREQGIRDDEAEETPSIGVIMSMVYTVTAEEQ